MYAYLNGWKHCTHHEVPANIFSAYSCFLSLLLTSSSRKDVVAAEAELLASSENG